MRYAKRTSLIFMIIFTLLSLFACDKTNDYYKEIEVENSEISLYVSEEKQIIILNKKEDSLYLFKSSNDTVTVDETGLIKANKIGSSIVSVSLNDYEYAAVYVVVKNNKPVDIENLSISNKVSKIKVKEELVLAYSKSPTNADNYNSIKWHSSDERMAIISENGVVKAISPGVVTVSVRASGTNKEDSFSLIIEANESKLSLDYQDVFGIVNTSDLKVNAYLETDYLNVEKGEWETSDENVVCILDDGLLSFKNSGKATVTYKVNTPTEALSAYCIVRVGEKEGYTIIRTAEQLQAIGDISGNYALGNDIDLEKACSKDGSLYHLGAGFTPLFSKPEAAFQGTFDGQGYSIKNIMIKTDQAFTALFRYINTNTSKEGKIINLALLGGSIEGGNFTSTFVGYISGGGSKDAGVKNCYTDTLLIARGSAAGLSGYNGGLIENCYSLSKIEASGDTASIALFTKNSNSEIGVKNTYVNKDINENITVLVTEDRIYQSIMEASYKTTEEMKDSSLYSSWDESIWLIVDNDYPKLRKPND